MTFVLYVCVLRECVLFQSHYLLSGAGAVQCARGTRVDLSPNKPIRCGDSMSRAPGHLNPTRCSHLPTHTRCSHLPCPHTARHCSHLPIARVAHSFVHMKRKVGCSHSPHVPLLSMHDRFIPIPSSPIPIPRKSPCAGASFVPRVFLQQQQPSASPLHPVPLSRNSASSRGGKASSAHVQELSC